MIAIIDYGMGNLQSIFNAFEALGEKPEIVKDPSKLKKAKAIVLPGVGAFYDGMKNLRKMGFIEALNKEVIEKKKPYLGICLGLQFLAEKSFEHGECEGLGWIKASVKRIETGDNSFKIPHIGWNSLKILKKDSLYEGLGDEPVFYFVHSYHLVPENKESNVVTSTSWHGEDVTASVQKDNIFATQFHPEKSQGAGLKLMENFIKIVNKSKVKENG